MTDPSANLSVRCPKCEADVPVPVEWQTPTIPPMVPNIPTLLLLGNIGHECQLTDIVKVLDSMPGPSESQLETVIEDLAKALLRLVDVAGMPDPYWQTDSRVKLARDVLSVPDDGRYSHAHLWTEDLGDD